MGSDSPPQQLFQGVLEAAIEMDAPLSLHAFASAALIENFSASLSSLLLKVKIHFHPTAEVITMDDNPLWAVRSKVDSSLLLGIQWLRENKLDALITAGNTGALITAAKLVLPMYPNIRRPALLAKLPTRKGMAAVIDVGGNIRSTLLALLQSAFLGAAYSRCFASIPMPQVGLLNIGTESQKGGSLLQETFTALQNRSGEKFQFIGNVEARDLFEGHVDVLVTDGFTGNILLKTAEGAGAFILNSCLEEIKDPTTLANLQKRFNYLESPGALVCGIDRLLIKCHGNATSRTIYHAIHSAILAVESDLIAHMRADLAEV